MDADDHQIRERSEDPLCKSAASPSGSACAQRLWQQRPLSDPQPRPPAAALTADCVDVSEDAHYAEAVASPRRLGSIRRHRLR